MNHFKIAYINYGSKQQGKGNHTLESLLLSYSCSWLTISQLNQRRQQKLHAKTTPLSTQGNSGEQPNTIVNLSGVAINDDETNLLVKGMSFIQTMSLEFKPVTRQSKSFFEHLHLDEFFAHYDRNDSDENSLFIFLAHEYLLRGDMWP